KSLASEVHAAQVGCGGGEGRLPLAAALPPLPEEIADDDDESDLQHQAENRREAADPAHQAMAEQHAEQTGAEKSGRKPAEQTRTVEEAARGCRRRRTRRRGGARRAGLARL